MWERVKAGRHFGLISVTSVRKSVCHASLVNHIPLSDTSIQTSFENIVVKGEIAHIEQF